ncbi:N-acetylmuramoyl-L-alanine amidase [Bacillus manliponensis]
MQTGWLYDNEKWYYLNHSGVMQKGWLYDNEKWYYLKDDGTVQVGWFNKDGNWYYLNHSGVVQTGWLYDGANWYYLNYSGAMQTGWMYDGANWYYLNDSGVMQTGWIEIDGIKYYFEANGVWVEKSTVFAKTVVVDPGHGAHDSGAYYGGVMEKTIALSVSLKLKSLLEQGGLKVVMTRTTDIYPSLNDRVNISNKNNADIFVSVHANAASSTAAHGIETLYYSKHPKAKEARSLANSVQSALIKNTGATNRKLKDRDNLRVLKGDNNAPPILVETGFVSNPSERMKLVSDSYQNVLAQSVFEGVQQYFSK